MQKAKKSSNRRKFIPVRTVAVSNDLLRMPVVMNAEEINAFFYVIAKIDPNTKPGQPIIVRFRIKEYVDVMRGIGYDYKNRKRLFESFKSLQQKTSGVVYNDGERRWLVSVFSDICPDDKSGGVIIRVDDLLGPHLLSLRNNFAVLDFVNVARLKLKGAKALYLYLKNSGGCPTQKHPGVKPRVVEIGTKELKEIFGLDEDDYTGNDKKTGRKKFSRWLFEQRILMPAIKEINGKDENGLGNTDMVIEWHKEMGTRSINGGPVEVVDRYSFTVKARANGSKTAPAKDYEELSLFDKEVATKTGEPCSPQDIEDIDENLRKEEREEAEERFRLWSDTAEGRRSTPQEADEIAKSMKEEPAENDDGKSKK
jgi:hypothetical protein